MPTGDITGDPDFSKPDGWSGKISFGYFRGCGEALLAVIRDDEADNTPKAKLPPTKRDLKDRQEFDEKLTTLPFPFGILLRGVIPVLRFIVRRMIEPKRGRRSRRASREESEYRQGICELEVEGERRSPNDNEAQRRAWLRLRERGDAVWDEVMQGAVTVYNRQRDVRVRVWKATYPTLPVERRLPPINDAAEMRRHVVAVGMVIKPPDGEPPNCHAGVYFACTWCADGFGAVIRDGEVIEVGPVTLVHSAKQRGNEVLNHPVLGPLRRIPDDDPYEVIDQWKMPTEAGKSGFDGVKRGGPYPWEGRVRLPSFQPHVLVADDRAQFQHDRARADSPRSAMAWEFAEGEFDLRVYTGADEEPSDSQAKAFAEFRSRERENADVIIRAILEHYQKTCESRRRDWLDRYVDDLVPVLTSPDGLRDLMQLRHVHVHPASADGRVVLAFQFVCTWEGDGFTILWRDGQTRYGKWNAARPKEAKETA
jgi:hypothetical protein